MLKQTLFSIVEMCQFSFSFFPWAFSHQKGFCSGFFPLIHVEQAWIYIKPLSWFLGLLCSTIVYICIASLCCTHFWLQKNKNNTFWTPVNGEWIEHVGECLTWCVTSLISDVIFLYQLAQAHPYNVLHFLTKLYEWKWKDYSYCCSG